MSSALDIITREILVPVLRAGSPDDAVEAEHALVAGGIRVLEITLTVPGAIGVIERLRREYDGEVLVGAGTVLDADTALSAIQHGAQFVVSPGFDLAVIDCCQSSGVAVAPGALTPTEVITAWKAGADLVKVFPAGNLGGPKYIRALRGPLPQIPLMPTGGVNLGTLREFLDAGAVAVGVGGELVSSAAIRNRDFNLLTENARAFLEVVHSRPKA